MIVKNEIDGKKIADNIRAERNRANVTMEAVEAELRITRPTYVDYEKDAEKIKVGTLIKLAKMFGCTVDCFFVQK